MSFPPPAPTATFPYRIEQRVGEGAMGVVFRAFEPALERTVAIKVLRPQTLAGRDEQTTEEYHRRFLQEARAAAALSHPGSATLYRIGDEAGNPWIAMEWLDGRPLDAVVREDGPLAPERVGRLGIELLAALDAAHRAGVVHRDIKPANLMLLADGRLKVTDFGIARLRGSDLVKTQAGYLLATPRFASPEQLRGLEVDGRSDLFSAGVVLYFLASGSYPFRGNDFLEVATAILTEAPRPLRTLAPHVPLRLAAAIERALEADLDKRFGSAAEMGDALRESMGLEGAMARTEKIAKTEGTSKPEKTAPKGAGGTGVPADREPVPTYADVAVEPIRAVPVVVASWPGRELGIQERQGLLDRLLDRPLHTAPFAGAVAFGAAWLLIAEGLVVAAIGPISSQGGATGDAAIEALPKTAAAVLHPAPEPGGALRVRALAGLLHPGQVRHEGLDSTFVNLPALGDKLRAERFDGAIHLARSGARATLLFAAGTPVCQLFSPGWDGLPIDRPWAELVSAVAVEARVEALAPVPSFSSYRRELRNFELQISRETAQADGRAEVGSRTKSTARVRFALDPALRGDPGRQPAIGVRLEDDPIHRFLRWSLEELPPYFRERERAARWKYLVEWLDDVRSARLHGELPRPDGTGADFFDLATFATDGRALHLAHRVARATPETLAEFRDAVIQAKSARVKTGDIGGAFLIAPEIDEATVQALAMLAATEKSGRWFGVEESFTGYEGFVRIGPRRGFHLLLIRESAAGFEPLLP